MPDSTSVGVPGAGEQAAQDKEEKKGIESDVHRDVDSQTGAVCAEDKESDGTSLRTISRRMSRQLVRRRSSVIESMPETPAGWAVLASLLLSAGLGYEIRLQQSLTQPPVIFRQPVGSKVMSHVYEKMTATPESILSRSIQPSLFVGTRGLISSTAAFLMGGPSTKQEHLRFREIVQSAQDGAQFGVDWEIPCNSTEKNIGTHPEDSRKAEILNGPIQQPVVIILHGINNDASFGYMKSFQRTFANRGWNAAAMNYRGCGGVPMTTPRSYNGSYTGDLRNLVWVLSGRMAEGVPIFLVGNSMGGSLLTKYLGEEGLSGTLPTCVAGAVALGNPLHMDLSKVTFPFNIAMGLGTKKTLLENWSSISKMSDPLHRQALRNALVSSTIGDMDDSVAPVMVRNNAIFPFAFRVGFKNGESYWNDSSSYRLIRHISIPYLKLSAEDDFLVAAPNRGKLGFCISNPNVMVVETRCGGHLGWQERPPDALLGISSWGDVASADFIDAVMKTNTELHGCQTGKQEPTEMMELVIGTDTKERMKSDARSSSNKLQARL